MKATFSRQRAEAIYSEYQGQGKKSGEASIRVVKNLGGGLTPFGTCLGQIHKSKDLKKEEGPIIYWDANKCLAHLVLIEH